VAYWDTLNFSYVFGAVSRLIELSLRVRTAANNAEPQNNLIQYPYFRRSKLYRTYENLSLLDISLLIMTILFTCVSRGLETLFPLLPVAPCKPRHFTTQIVAFDCLRSNQLSCLWYPPLRTHPENQRVLPQTLTSSVH
jgi:hypothetical protein